MKTITDFWKIDHLSNDIRIEKVYPLSILEGTQRGEIFVDNDEAPTAVLIWHYCGFANILGNCNKSFVNEIMEMMKDPPEGHSGRMTLQTEEDSRFADMIMKKPRVARYERYIFEFAGEKGAILCTSEADLKEISADNYGLMNGRIIPAFSWDSKERFLKNGFGYCMIKDGQMLACAFASGISKDYVDIGVETTEECRGKGYGRIVASAMVKETLHRGKTPVWGCDTRNQASMKLALSVGFEIVGTHPWYKYES